MSRFTEYISPAGLRLDGRRCLEGRRVLFELGCEVGADGSCVVTCGGTQVRAVVYGPKEGRKDSSARQDLASFTCEVEFSAYGQERRRSTKRSRQVTELGQLLGKLFRSVIKLGQYPGSEIQLVIEVIRQDGSETSTAINAGAFALINANVAMSDFPVATTMAMIDGKVVVDPTQIECRSQCPQCLIATRAHATSSILLIDMDSRVSEEMLDETVKAAETSLKTFVSNDAFRVLSEYVKKQLGELH